MLLLLTILLLVIVFLVLLLVLMTKLLLLSQFIFVREVTDVVGDDTGIQCDTAAAGVGEEIIAVEFVYFSCFC